MNETVIDVIVAALLLGGATMSLAAAIGLTRFPDLMSRMHAASKPQVLGLLLFLLAMAVEFRSWVLLPVLALCWIFMLLTAPVSAHMVGRAGYRTKHLRPELLTIDELDDVVERAQQLMFEASRNTPPGARTRIRRWMTIQARNRTAATTPVNSAMRNWPGPVPKPKPGSCRRGAAAKADPPRKSIEMTETARMNVHTGSFCDLDGGGG